jgi:superfamily II DNA or RNA helicase
MFDLSLGGALRNGIVSPLEVIEIAAEIPRKREADMTNKYRRFSGRSNSSGQPLKWMHCFGPISRQYLGRHGMLAMSRRKELLSWIESKKEKILDVIGRHLNQRIILFAESVQRIEEITDYLTSNEVSCETFHSGTEPWRRMEILED